MSRKKISTPFFIEKARQINGDKYDYSKVEYIDSKTKVCIICPEHGEFWQTPNNHLSKKAGCPICKTKIISSIWSSNTKSFIEKSKQIHGDKYDYSKVEYVNSSTKVCIVCPEHGNFWQTPNDHLQGSGCPKCAGVKRLTTEEFIKRAKVIHGDKYDYSKVEYKNANTKVCIICPKHGEFWQKANDHLKGHGCLICKESNGEKAIRIWCEHNNLKNNIDYIMQYRTSWLKRQTIDFFFPNINIGIEFDGRQHFIPIEFFGGKQRLEEQKAEDLKKQMLCESHNIKLIRISNLDDIDNILNNIIGENKIND